MSPPFRPLGLAIPNRDNLFVRNGTSQVNWVIGATTGLWEAANSPYYVVGDLNVPADGELVIEPGVQVLLEGDFEFTVYGTLEANGTSADPINFTTIDPPAAGWG